MNGKIIAILIAMFLSNASKSLATAVSLKVNHITKEYDLIEDEDWSGFIGWQGLGEIPDDKEQQLINMGYTFTKNPFLLDQIFLLTITIILVAFAAVKMRCRLNNKIRFQSR